MASTPPTLSTYPVDVYAVTREINGESWDEFSFTLRIPLQKDFAYPGRITVNLFDKEDHALGINRVIWDPPAELAASKNQFITVYYQDCLRSILNVARAEVWILPGDPRPQAQANISVPIKHYTQKGKYELPFAGWWQVVDDNALPHDSTQENITSAFGWRFVKRGEQGLVSKGVYADLFNHVSYGQPVLAAADGKVAKIQSGYIDNKLNVPPKVNHLTDLWGNYVVLDHGNGEYSYYANLSNASIKVRVGQKVTRGQILASCGCSGDSNLPSLLFGFIDKPNPYKKPEATLALLDPAAFGASPLPVCFESIVWNEAGNQTINNTNPGPGATVANLTPDIIMEIEGE